MDKFAKIEDVQMDLTLSQVGTLFAKSGMFTGVKDEAQALTKILAGRELGFSPFTSMSDLHIVQGKMTIGAHLFAARLKEHPAYDFEVEEHTNEKCVIAIYEFNKRTQQWRLAGKSEFTITDAKKAGVVKSGSGWEKTPRNMLYARAMSNGCKWYAPDLFQASMYALGEIPEPKQQVEHIEAVEEPSEEDLNIVELAQVKRNVHALWEKFDIHPAHADKSFKKYCREYGREEMTLDTCDDVEFIRAYGKAKQEEYKQRAADAKAKAEQKNEPTDEDVKQDREWLIDNLPVAKSIKAVERYDKAVELQDWEELAKIMHEYRDQFVKEFSGRVDPLDQ